MISNDECFEIIKKSINNINFKIINYEIKKATDDNVGFLGEYYNLLTKIENENSVQELNFFIKTIPQTNLEHRKIIQEAEVFKKEEKVYKLFQQWDDELYNLKFYPKCLYTKKELIVLEDLSLSGYYQLEDGNEFNLSQLKAVLSALASMHASSIVYETKNNIRIDDQLKNELFETSITKDVPWFLTGIEAVRFIASKHPQFQDNEHQNFIATKFLEKLDPVCNMVNSSSIYRNVLCHRDVWGRNIFFKNDDTNNNNISVSSVLVDYQTCRYCPPAIDILFLLHLNVRKSFRSKIYLECLDFYHKELQNNLKNVQIPEEYHISYEEIEKSCKDFKLFGLVYDCLAATVVRLPKGFLPNLKKEHPEKYFKFINVSRNEIMSELLQNDNNFKEYLFDSVKELMDLIY